MLTTIAADAVASLANPGERRCVMHRFCLQNVENQGNSQFETESFRPTKWVPVCKTGSDSAAEGHDFCRVRFQQCLCPVPATHLVGGLPSWCCSRLLHCFTLPSFSVFFHNMAAAPPHPPPPPRPEPSGFYKCETCNILMTGEASWNEHVRGAPHRKRAFRAAATHGPGYASHSTRWTCPTCLASNDAPTSLISHVSGAGHRRAVAVLKDSGRHSELHVLLPRLRAAVREVRRAGDDDARLAEVLRDAEHDAGILAPAAAAHDAGRTAPSHARAPAAGRGGSSGAGGAAGGARSGPPPADARRHKRRRDDDACASWSEGLADAADAGRGRRPTSSGHSDSSGASPQSTGVGDNAWANGYSARTSPGGASASLTTAAGRVPVAVVVPPGARVWFECPRCGCHYRSGDDYVAHVCQPYKGKGKGRAE